MTNDLCYRKLTPEGIIPIICDMHRDGGPDAAGEKCPYYCDRGACRKRGLCGVEDGTYCAGCAELVLRETVKADEALPRCPNRGAGACVYLSKFFPEITNEPICVYCLTPESVKVKPSSPTAPNEEDHPEFFQRLRQDLLAVIGYGRTETKESARTAYVGSRAEKFDSRRFVSTSDPVACDKCGDLHVLAGNRIGSCRELPSCCKLSMVAIGQPCWPTCQVVPQVLPEGEEVLLGVVVRLEKRLMEAEQLVLGAYYRRAVRTDEWQKRACEFCLPLSARDLGDSFLPPDVSIIDYKLNDCPACAGLLCLHVCPDKYSTKNVAPRVACNLCGDLHIVAGERVGPCRTTKPAELFSTVEVTVDHGARLVLYASKADASNVIKDLRVGHVPIQDVLSAIQNGERMLGGVLGSGASKLPKVYHSKEHLAAALTWIEQNLDKIAPVASESTTRPGRLHGVHLVAQALAETSK